MYEYKERDRRDRERKLELVIQVTIIDTIVILTESDKANNIKDFFGSVCFDVIR